MFPGGAQGSMRRLSGGDSEAVRCSFSAFLGKQVEGIGGRKCCDFFSTWEGIEALRLTRVFHYGASGFGLPGAFFAFKRRERQGWMTVFAWVVRARGKRPFFPRRAREASSVNAAGQKRAVFSPLGGGGGTHGVLREEGLYR